MIQLVVQFQPLDFPASAKEAEYLADQVRHGWELISVLVARQVTCYYWKRYDGVPGPAPQTLKDDIARRMGS